MLRDEPAWEGLTWVLELLDESPRMAIDVLNAYIWAHLQPLDRPYWYERIYDAIALIRAKYIGTAQPRDVFLNLGGRKFERLTHSLFHAMGHEVEPTSKSYDGGVDLRAHQKRDGQCYTSLIQCKCVTKNVGVKDIRELHGTLENEKVSKGILVTASKFTPKAREWASKNPRLELINFETLNQLLNEHLGPLWVQRIDWYCRDLDFKRTS
jgi:restriction system protein